MQDKLVDTRVVVEQESDELVPLYYIVDNYRRNIWLKPPHQRERVWSETQKHGWVERMQSGRSPVGVIVTYQIVGEGPIYINDGFQRVSTTLEYLQMPDVYGDTPTEAERVIFACKMPHQHRLYRSHDDALVDFQLLNLGTHLTPYEFCKGILVYMPAYESWAALLASIHDLLPQGESRIASKRYKTGREEVHKRMRHDYALFLRYLVRSTDLTDYQVTETKINPVDVSRHKVIEWQIRMALEDTTPQAAREHLGGLERLIERETALLETIWFDELKKSRGSGISPTLYRWIMDVAVWRKNSNVPQEHWEQFLRKLLDVSNGLSQITRIDETNGKLRNKYTLNLARLSSLKGVCDIIGSNLYSYRPQKRIRQLANTRPGYDESHVLPFHANGNGDTFPEPAGRNRARGSKPVATNPSANG